MNCATFYITTNKQIIMRNNNFSKLKNNFIQTISKQIMQSEELSSLGKSTKSPEQLLSTTNENTYTIFQKLSLNLELMNAVASHDVSRVKFIVNRGANVNYKQYNDEDDPDGYIQPTTPLRMVVFRISDCLLEDEHIDKFLIITRLLLKHGADPRDALPIITFRYGENHPYDANASAKEKTFRNILIAIQRSATTTIA